MPDLLRALLAAAILWLPAAARSEGFGDAEAGAAVFARECSACHAVEAGGQAMVGPHLAGVFGRRAGSEAFGYSPSMARAGAEGLVWTLATLDAYVENPRALVTGTRMSYRGLKDAGARADLMAWLRAASASPADIPEAPPTAVQRLPDLPPEVLALKGDRDWGAYLAQECTTCHRRDGADAGIPAITGWPEEDFVVAMHAYRQKLRPHPVMQMMAGRLSAEEIAALAAHFAHLD